MRPILDDEVDIEGKEGAVEVEGFLGGVGGDLQGQESEAASLVVGIGVRYRFGFNLDIDRRGLDRDRGRGEDGEGRIRCLNDQIGKFGLAVFAVALSVVRSDRRVVIGDIFLLRDFLGVGIGLRAEDGGNGRRGRRRGEVFDVRKGQRRRSRRGSKETRLR